MRIGGLIPLKYVGYPALAYGRTLLVGAVNVDPIIVPLCILPNRKLFNQGDTWLRLAEAF
jgi:hypothetical protein